MAKLPSGTVTFLFADVEGSTRRLEEDAVATGRLLARLLEVTQGIVEANHGAVFETVGDAAYAAFGRASDAIAASASLHGAMAEHAAGGDDPLRVRIGLHTGEVEARGRHYFGPVLFRCARLQALAWGGQTLLSSVTARLVAGSLPADHRLVDRGVHSLKDLTEPEHVHELVGPATPDFDGLRVAEVRAGNLPEHRPSLVGRDQDLAELERIVGGARLVTITGPGGTGKTAIAVEVASRLARTTSDGVWFVDLAPLREPEAVPAAIASSIGVDEQPPASLIDTLAGHLQPRESLLVLDNFEQVSPAAPIVGRLLAAPRLRVLVTSREPLRLRDEREYPLSPLGLASGRRSFEGIEAAPSVQLFVLRARDLVPFELSPENASTIAEICVRLDGLPLAIELAAPMLRVLTPDQLLDRLGTRLDLLAARSRDLPERQRTLRAAMTWSFELLGSDEQRAFEGLGVFADGFTLSAAEAVLEDLELDVISAIGGLIDKSLLVRDLTAAAEARFRMLDTVREFALERLRASAESGLRWRAFSSWALSVVTREGSPMRWTEAVPSVRLFRAERKNVVEAMRWLHEAGAIDEFIELVAASSSFWIAAALISDGRTWIRLAAELDGPPSPWTGRLLRNAGSIEHDLGQSAAGVDLLRRSIDVWAALGDDTERADALRRLGATLMDRGDWAEAREALTQALWLARANKDGATERASLNDLSAIAIETRQLEEADVLLREMLESAVRSDDTFGIAMARGNWSYLLLLRGDLRTAEAQAREAARILGSIDKNNLLGWSLINLASVLAEEGRLDEAAQIAHRSLELVGESRLVRDTSACLDVIAAIAVRLGDTRRAVDATIAAERIRADAELSLPSVDKERIDATMEAARAALGTEFDLVVAEAGAKAVDAVVHDELARAADLAPESGTVEHPTMVAR
jgi:predicted ATPase/class 3 adenylate cyclase